MSGNGEAALVERLDTLSRQLAEMGAEVKGLGHDVKGLRGGVRQDIEDALERMSITMPVLARAAAGELLTAHLRDEHIGRRSET